MKNRPTDFVHSGFLKLRIFSATLSASTLVAAILMVGARTSLAQDIPRSLDTARFGRAGINAGKVLSLDTAQIVSNIIIETTAPFTIGNAADTAAGYTLTLNSVDRMDVAGTEGIHAFAAPVIMVPDGNSNSVWTIDGDGVLQMNASLGSTAAPVTFVKRGFGTFNMNYSSPTFQGSWSILEGTVTATAGSSMRGTITVGGSTAPASLTQVNKNALFKPTSIIVLTNGTFTAGDIDNDRVQRIHAKEGGVATIGSYFYSFQAYLTGGRINGGTFFGGGYGQVLRSYASPVTATMNAEFMMGNYPTYDSTIEVDDGSPAIDLLVLKSILTSGNTGRYLNRKGTGTAVFTQPSTYINGNGTNAIGWRLQAGRTLFNNTSGSGVGKNPMQVDGGATVGGTGFLGGDSAYPNFNLRAQGSSLSSLATVAPGSVDAQTGDSLIGTLTVGSATYANSVTFGNYSQLEMQIGSQGNSDRLEIFGTLDLSASSDKLVLSIAENPKAGTYLLVSATGGITGTFNIFSDPLLAKHLIYTETTLSYNVPSMSTLLFAQ